MIKRPSGQSMGQSFDTEETQSVIVTDEALDLSSGYEGDAVVYTATVRDDYIHGQRALPANFVVDLLINGTELLSGQVLDAVVYDPVTFLLTLTWVVPKLVIGSFDVKLSWDEQIIK